MLSTLLRLLDLDKGSIFVDGTDLSRVPRSIVRERCFITIPQDPFITIEASLRFNIDAFERYSDNQVVCALEEARLWAHFSKLGDGEEQCLLGTSRLGVEEVLDQPLTSFPPLTLGQLQLLSLSRAVLRSRPPLKMPHLESSSKPILLLDEATASLDLETEAFVQDLIHKKFTSQGHTVIMVAHRVGLEMGSNGTREFDKVIWMDQGKVVRVEEKVDI